MSLMRNLFGNGPANNLPGPFGGIMNFMQKFQQFQQNPLSILTGLNNVNIPPNIGNDPQAIVNYLRNSGQMTDQQFNQLSQMANQFQQFMPRKF